MTRTYRFHVLGIRDYDCFEEVLDELRGQYPEITNEAGNRLFGISAVANDLQTSAVVTIAAQADSEEAAAVFEQIVEVSENFHPFFQALGRHADRVIDDYTE